MALRLCIPTRVQLPLIVLGMGITAVWVQPAQSQIPLTPAFPTLFFANPVDLQHPGD